ncbi:MAG: hypothetical protein LBI70_02355 [Rickettsiales bacterium]|nr:hypothetical protein [Rickettsiales bacterium]
MFSYDVFFVFLGLLAGVANDAGLRYTVGRFIRSGREKIIVFGLLLRLSAIALVLCGVAQGSSRGFIVMISSIILSRLATKFLRITKFRRQYAHKYR